MRVIITGSRNWRDKFPIAYDISRLHVDHGENLVIVHGDNRDPDCADAIAHSHALVNDIKVEPWPVSRDEWNAYGRSAGPQRNKRMVNAGADLCLAYIAPCVSPRCADVLVHGSHGASGCAQLAVAAGIKTEVRRQGW